MSAYVQKQSFNRKLSISALEQVSASSAWEAVGLPPASCGLTNLKQLVSDEKH